MYASKTLDVRPQQGEALDAAIDRVVNEYLRDQQMKGEFKLISTHFTLSEAYKKILVVLFYDFIEHEAHFSGSDLE